MARRLTTLLGLLAVAIRSSLACTAQIPADAASISWLPVSDQIINIFENGSPQFAWSYCKDIKDGRGATAGYRGFTTGTQDAFVVLDLFSPGSKADSQKKSTSSFCKQWRSFDAKDPDCFRASQQSVAFDQQIKPTIDFVRARPPLQSNLAHLLVYDAFVQHGLNDDEFGKGITSMWATTMAAVGSSATEPVALAAFLDARRKVLLEGGKIWKESVPRVDALQKLYNDGNFNLTTPLFITDYWYSEPLPALLTSSASHLCYPLLTLVLPFFLAFL